MSTKADICPLCGSGLLNGEHIADYQPCAGIKTALDLLRGIDYDEGSRVDRAVLALEEALSTSGS